MDCRHTYPLRTLPEPASRAGRAIEGAAAIKAGTAAGIAGVLKDTAASSAIAKDLVRLSRTYKLPPELKKGLEEAWERSLLVGETGIRGRENGGILVRTWPAGSLEWRPVKPGMSDEIEIGADTLAGETLLATGHTHPYGELAGSVTGVGLSGDDLAALALGGVPMMFVRSGDTVSMARRTDAVDKLLTEKGRAALHSEILATYDEAMARFPGSLVAGSHAGTMAVCKAFGLDYFRGEGDTLIREDVSTFRLPP